MKDEQFMRRCLELAQEAYEAGEVPIGALVTFEGKILAEGRNRVEELGDATAHAEMLALRGAAKYFSSWRMQGAQLYCTLEPCSMCAGATLLSRISRIVWGACDLRHGAGGSWVDLFDGRHPMHPHLEVARGVMEMESAALMRKFFEERRK